MYNFRRIVTVIYIFSPEVFPDFLGADFFKDSIRDALIRWPGLRVCVLPFPRSAEVPYQHPYPNTNTQGRHTNNHLKRPGFHPAGRKMSRCTNCLQIMF